MEQNRDEVIFHCPDDESAFWDHYFDLGTDYGAYIRAVDPADEYLSKAAAFGSGIRILNQDLWEMIITFIISQQKTIPAIRALVEALSEKYGTRYELSSGYYYAFPTPEELNHASLDDLLALKLGYRAKYIKRTCEDVCSGKMDLDPSAGTELFRLHGSSSLLLRNRRQSCQLHLPLRSAPYRCLPGGHLDQKDPAAGVCPEKPLHQSCSRITALRGADRRKFLEISGVRRCAAAVYLLL